MGNDFDGVLRTEHDLTISEAAQLKFDLEAAILKLVKDFEAMTELAVVEIIFNGEDVVVEAIL